MEDARKIIHPILQDVLADAPEGTVKHTTSRYEVNFVNGSSLTIAGADSAGNSIRGRGFDLVILEESGQWSSDNYLYNLNSVIRPTLLHSKEKVKLIHCTTPSAKEIDHPLHTVTLLQRPVLRFTIYDNPLLSNEQIEQECKDQGGEGSFSWRVEYLCEITRNSNFALLPSFDKIRHSFKLITDQHSGLIGVFDLGGTRDKSAYIEAYRKDEVIHITHAKLWANMTSIEDMAQYMLARDVKVRVGDLSGQSSIEFSNRGLTFLFPSKTHFEVMLTELNSGFHHDSIKIHEELDELIDNCVVGQFNNTRTDFARTEKYGHSDLIAALNYTWRMRKQFDILDKRYRESCEENSLSYNNTNHLHHKAKMAKKRKALSSLTGNKRSYT